MRKVETVTVPEWGDRDRGKMFRITEMPSARAEKWGIRAIMLLNGSGERIPEGIAGRGMEAIAIVGINVFLQGTIKQEHLDPLLDEMMTCVEVIRDKSHPEVATALVSDDDIEEVKTRLWLRSEVLRLHVGFSPADALSALMSAILTPRPDSGNI